MHTRCRLLFMVVVWAGASVLRGAPAPETTERIAASFLLALGRGPTPAELAAWAPDGTPTVAELLARQRAQLASDAEARRAVVARACRDALGRAPQADEAAAGATGTVRTYTELVTAHVAQLATQPDDYPAVIERAYHAAVGRPAYPEEFVYWRQRETLPYALLVGCIEDWARRNSPGLTLTAGTPTISIHSRFLTTWRLSPAIAAEARTAAGLPPAGDPQLALAVGRNLVAPGAATVATGGGIAFVAAGGAELAGAVERASSGATPSGEPVGL